MPLRGQPRWWYGACLLAVLAAALAPIGVVRRLVAPTALLLPLSTWSILEVREHRHRTEALVFVGSRPGWLLGATHLSGVAVDAAVTFPAGVRSALAGTVGAVLGWIVGLLFLPPFALALGVWLGRPAVFEIVYLTAWYLGPVNGVEPVDYLGVRDPTVASGVRGCTPASPSCRSRPRSSVDAGGKRSSASRLADSFRARLCPVVWHFSGPTPGRARTAPDRSRRPRATPRLHGWMGHQLLPSDGASPPFRAESRRTCGSLRSGATQGFRS